MKLKLLCFLGVENADYNLYPNKAFQMGWLADYVREYHKLKNSGSCLSDDDVNKEVEVLYKQVNKFSLVSFTTYFATYKCVINV